MKNTKQHLSRLFRKFELVVADSRPEHSRRFSLRFTFPVSLIAVCCLLLGTVPNRAFASTTWTETSDTNFNDGIYNLTRTSGTGTAAQLTLSPFGNAADGSVSITEYKNISTNTISGGRTYADGVNYGVSSIYTSSITCSATPNGIVAGDEIIIINQQGDGTNYDNVGNYEFLRIKSVSGDQLAFTSDIQKIYGATTSNSDLTGQKVTVQRVPNWGSVDISGSGVTLTCSAWDGTKGGMVIFRATATLTVGTGASIDVSGKGYRGGAGGAGGASTGAGGLGGQGGETVYGYMSYSEDGGGTIGGTGHLIAGGVRGGKSSGSANYADGWGAGGSSDRASAGGGGAGGNSDIQKTDFSAEKICLGPGAGGGGGGAGGNRSFDTDQGGTAGGGGGGAGGGICIVFANEISVSGEVKATAGKGAGGGGAATLYPVAPSQGAGGAGGTVGQGGVGTNGNGGNGNTGAGLGGESVDDTNDGVSDAGGTGGDTNVSGGGNGVNGDMGLYDVSGAGGAGASGGGGGGSGFDCGAGAGGGRGAGGGSIYLSAVSMNIGNYQIIVDSGIGGGGGGGSNGDAATAGDGGGPESSPSGTDDSAGNNGGGGAMGARGALGKIRIDCDSVTGTTDPAHYAGTFPSGWGTYPANYKSDVLDSGADDTKVHQVDWNPTSQAAGTSVQVSVRASNSSFASGDTTPAWISVSNGGNPALVGRYIQWMSTFTTTSSTTTPRVEDITLTYTSPPPAPAVNYNAGNSYSQITWKWADNSSGQYQEDGFKVYSSTGGILKTLSADTTCWTEAGLKRNTKYGRYVQSYNTAGSNNSVTVNKKTQPCVWQEKATTRTGPNAFGFEGDGIWTWKVPANGGSLLTITAFVRYNSDYGAAAKPKFTLYNYGVNSTAQMTGGADTWEKLTVSGTPSGKGVLFLKVEGFSTAVDAKYFVDDIQVNQP